MRSSRDIPMPGRGHSRRSTYSSRSVGISGPRATPELPHHVRIFQDRKTSTYARTFQLRSKRSSALRRPASPKRRRSAGSPANRRIAAVTVARQYENPVHVVLDQFGNGARATAHDRQLHGHRLDDAIGRDATAERTKKYAVRYLSTTPSNATDPTKSTSFSRPTSRRRA